ncbi:MAG TPA: hypothetical protein VKU90_12160, partial [Caulobacteraceae bacterium]|nr:hypothetical protein [Caulobacteraceae bacterium]
MPSNTTKAAVRGRASLLATSMFATSLLAGAGGLMGATVAPGVAVAGVCTPPPSAGEGPGGFPPTPNTTETCVGGFGGLEYQAADPSGNLAVTLEPIAPGPGGGSSVGINGVYIADPNVVNGAISFIVDTTTAPSGGIVGLTPDFGFGNAVGIFMATGPNGSIVLNTGNSANFAGAQVLGGTYGIEVGGGSNETITTANTVTGGNVGILVHDIGGDIVGNVTMVNQASVTGNIGLSVTATGNIVETQTGGTITGLVTDGVDLTSTGGSINATFAGNSVGTGGPAIKATTVNAADTVTVLGNATGLFDAVIANVTGTGAGATVNLGNATLGFNVTSTNAFAVLAQNTNAANTAPVAVNVVMPGNVTLASGIADIAAITAGSGNATVTMTGTGGNITAQGALGGFPNGVEAQSGSGNATVITNNGLHITLGNLSNRADGVVAQTSGPGVDTITVGANNTIVIGNASTSSTPFGLWATGTPSATNITAGPGLTITINGFNLPAGIEATNSTGNTTITLGAAGGGKGITVNDGGANTSTAFGIQASGNNTTINTGGTAITVGNGTGIGATATNALSITTGASVTATNGPGINGASSAGNVAINVNAGTVDAGNATTPAITFLNSTGNTTSALTIASGAKVENTSALDTGLAIQSATKGSVSVTDNGTLIGVVDFSKVGPTKGNVSNVSVTVGAGGLWETSGTDVFGLGNATTVDSLTINGTVETLGSTTFQFGNSTAAGASNSITINPGGLLNVFADLNIVDPSVTLTN